MYKSDIKNDYFDYEKLFSTFEPQKIKTVINRLNKHSAKVANNLDTTTNTQWIIRTYLASKMILASSVMLTSSEYAKEKNLRIVEPYLLYYPLLSCARAVIFTHPLLEWNNDIIEMNHSKTIKLVGNYISEYNKEKGEHIKLLINKYRIYREIYSYKFPANGLTSNKINLDFNEVVDICALLSEVAQLQSAILESSITKHCQFNFNIDDRELHKIYLYGEEKFCFIDKEDVYRLDYINRNVHRPLSIINTMTEGMVEDFFGAWCSQNEEEIDDVYNPDENWSIIFPVP